MTTPENEATKKSLLNLTTRASFERVTTEIKTEARTSLLQACVEMNDARATRNATIGYVLAARILTQAEVMEITGLSRQRCYQLKREYVESTPRPAGTSDQPLF